MFKVSLISIEIAHGE